MTMIQPELSLFAAPVSVNLSEKDRARFIKKVNKDGPIHPYTPEKGKCWVWTAAKDPNGYGRFHFGTRHQVILAHRFSFLAYNGFIPDSRVARHTCDNPSCVNPEHLLSGTQKDNSEDSRRSGRMALASNGRHRSITKPESIARGAQHWAAGFTESTVSEIRERHAKGGISYLELGAIYGVTRSAIGLIIRRKRWAHVP